MGVADKGSITGEILRVGLDILFNGFAPSLFLALNQHLYIDWQHAIDGHQRLQRLQGQHGLPFIVAGTPAVEIAVANSWLERGRIPKLDRIDRLYVIMTVN